MRRTDKRNFVASVFAWLTKENHRTHTNTTQKLLCRNALYRCIKIVSTPVATRRIPTKRCWWLPVAIKFSPPPTPPPLPQITSHIIDVAGFHMKALLFSWNWSIFRKLLAGYKQSDSVKAKASHAMLRFWDAKCIFRLEENTFLPAHCGGGCSCVNILVQDDIAAHHARHSGFESGTKTKCGPENLRLSSACMSSSYAPWSSGGKWAVVEWWAGLLYSSLFDDFLYHLRNSLCYPEVGFGRATNMAN